MKELKINIYGDCTSEKPVKTYTVRRLLFKTAKELGALREESAAASDNDQEKITLAMIKCVIPDFEDADFDGVDPLELGAFFRDLGAEISTIVQNAAKN